MVGTGGQGGNTGVTDEHLHARLRDPRYFTNNPAYDPAFAAETERLNKQRRGGVAR